MSAQTSHTMTMPAVDHAPPAVTNVLIANRGEIARRVIATCRRLSIGTVAVHSDADSESLHVREADASVRLPGSTPAETYLRSDLIIEAAQAAGADAIHPGYGFLSENADFAAAVQDAGLTWIGPDPESITVMGSKAESKRLMDEAGVPVLKALDPSEVTADHLPVLVKASAGGGGRGMRVVEDLADLEETLASAAREAESAFGDPTVLVERYLPRGHHIEVQVFGDRDGNVWAIGERECSLQRRHQKVIEEAPSPLVERVGGGMRERLFSAARDAAARIGYVGAGTVEFLADENGEFFFLEMNTRLQVEHPVTECTTGLDLVELQLDVATGGTLAGSPPESNGHAIEVRLYAEDPSAGWQPQSGPVHRLRVPALRSEFSVLTQTGVRLDAGVGNGSMIGTDYDPMIAKVIGVAPTRDKASRLLAGALQRAEIHGPRTNRDLLVRTLLEQDFLDGYTDTAYFDEHPEVFIPSADNTLEQLCAIASAIASAEAVLDGQGEFRQPGEQDLADSVRAHHPMPRIRGWRLFANGYRTREYTIDDRELTASYRWSRDRYEIDPEVLPKAIRTVEVLSASANEVSLSVDGVTRRFAINDTGASVFVDTAAGSVVLDRTPRFIDASELSAPGSMVAPMPGTIIRVAVDQGSRVVAGQPLLWMEAMKMEHTITAAADGVVTDLRVTTGDRVDVGQLLVIIEEDE